jgi:hypothetical protein
MLVEVRTRIIVTNASGRKLLPFRKTRNNENLGDSMHLVLIIA